jgi:hypothetical protein
VEMKGTVSAWRGDDTACRPGLYFSPSFRCEASHILDGVGNRLQTVSRAERKSSSLQAGSFPIVAIAPVKNSLSGFTATNVLSRLRLSP